MQPTSPQSTHRPIPPVSASLKLVHMHVKLPPASPPRRTSPRKRPLQSPEPSSRPTTRHITEFHPASDVGHSLRTIPSPPVSQNTLGYEPPSTVPRTFTNPSTSFLQSPAIKACYDGDFRR